MLTKIEGHLVSGYHDGGDAPDKQLELVPGAVKDAEAFLPERRRHAGPVRSGWQAGRGFETPFGLELLATVHWVATRENATGAEEAVAKVYAWNDRKKRFSPRQIGIAYEDPSCERVADARDENRYLRKGPRDPHRRRHDRPGRGAGRWRFLRGARAFRRAAQLAARRSEGL